jgi:hypothetical protein
MLYTSLLALTSTNSLSPKRLNNNRTDRKYRNSKKRARSIIMFLRKVGASARQDLTKIACLFSAAV